jgi:hypothetical protein
MVEINNGATFQCYFSKAKSFDGIFSKSGSFNGMDLIFPKSWQWQASGEGASP